MLQEGQVRRRRGGEVGRIRGGRRLVDGQERVAGAVRGKGGAQSLQSLQSLPTRRGGVLSITQQNQNKA